MKLLTDSASLFLTSLGITRAINLKKQMLLKSPEGSIQKIVSKKQIKKTFYRVILDNGSSIILDTNYYVETLSGRKNIQELSKDDLIKVSFNCDFKQHRLAAISWEDLKGNVPLVIPKKMTIDLAIFLGLVISCCEFNSDYVRMIAKRPNVDLFCLLAKKLFDYTPIEVIDDNIKYFSITSGNLGRFMQKEVGSNRGIYRVPKSIMMGATLIKNAFIKGISSSSCINNEGQYILYNGGSKFISDFLAVYLRGNGYGVKTYSIITEKLKKYYYTVIPFASNHRLEFLSDIVFDKSFFSKIDPEVYDIKVQKNNKGYESFKKIRRERKLYTKYSTLTKIGFLGDPDFYYIKIKEIKKETSIILELELSNNGIFHNSIPIFSKK